MCYQRSLSRTYEELKQGSKLNGEVIEGEFIAYLWGIETKTLFLVLMLRVVFIAYLWGIETPSVCYQLRFIAYSLSRTYEELKQDKFLSIEKLQYKFIAYLWGIETFLLTLNPKIFPNSFIAYLWGIETSIQTSIYEIFFIVYRVPMRNWNFPFFASSTKGNFSGLSRTYEELKRFFPNFIAWSLFSFIAYLWGIETI